MDLVNLLDILDKSGEEDQLNDSHTIMRVLKDRTDPFDVYDDAKFRIRYRFHKETARQLIDLLEDPLRRRNHALSPAQQVLMTLRFLGTGCFQREDGDLHGIDQSTVSRRIHVVLRAIAELKPRFISFPSPEEFQQIKEGFYRKRGFPGVIGAIDCTHVPILNPGGEDAELYRNRKGWFSINVQLVCDNKLVIRNIVASWRGSTHDSRIFNQSSLKDTLEGIPGRVHLLGDRGYPCLRYLLTPLANPQSAAKKRYNFAHSSTRMAVERLNGVIKRRFPCLSGTLRFKPEKCCVAIVACAILHNLANMNNDPEIEEGEDTDQTDDDDNEAGNGRNDNAQGSAKRRAIIDQYFS